MELPYVIQYLLTLRDPGGSPLVYAGMGQEVIPFFPPGRSLKLETDPGDDYAHIGFFASVGPAVVPGTFYSAAWQAGGRVYEGLITGWFTGNDLYSFLVQTHALPSIAILTNISPLVQYYEGILAFLRVATKEDYGLVMDGLDRLGTSSKLESAAIQAASLLETMRRVRPPIPLPVIGGGR